MIGIIDYGMGNLNSVYNAFEYIGEDPLIIDDISKFDECTHLVIPGVGSYHKAMENIKAKGYLPKIKEHKEKNKPILGICLGMQILSTIGYEVKRTEGLDFIPGEVKKFEIDERVPHVGWNEVHFNYDHPIFEGIKKDVDFYFVHSYFFDTLNKDNIFGITSYGIEFPSIVINQNVIGIQFHPEKSQENGLKILDNFAQWDFEC